MFLCYFDDLPEGGSKGVHPNERGRDQILLVRQGSRVYGYLNACPHYGRTPLGWKKDEFLNKNQDRIMCAAHGALFRVNDGVCVLGPCLGQRLKKRSVVVRDGKVILLDQ